MIVYSKPGKMYLACTTMDFLEEVWGAQDKF